VHKRQVGEPLLNEVVQVSLWVAFLDTAPELWALQRGGPGAGMVREEAVVRARPWLVGAAVWAGLDTAVLVDGTCGSGAYVACLRLAAGFDRGCVRDEGYPGGGGALLEPAAGARRAAVRGLSAGRPQGAGTGAGRAYADRGARASGG